MAFLTKLKAKTAGLAGSRRFDGSAQFWKTASALDLSGTQKATLSFWLIWNAYSNADATCVCEQGPNVAANTGFFVDPDSSTALFGFYVKPAGGVVDGNQFARPSAGTWHHYALIFDTSQANGSKCYQAWVDGVKQTLSSLTIGSGTGNLGNDTVYFMSRAGTTKFGAGSLCDFAIFTDILSPSQVQQLAAGATPRYVAGGILKAHWDMASGGSAMPDLSGNGNQLSSTTVPSGSTSVPPQLVRGLPTTLDRFSPTSPVLVESVSDSLILSDLLGLGYGDIFSDNLSNWANALVGGLVLPASDNLNNWADSVFSSLSTALISSDSLTLTDGMALGYGSRIAESLTPSESVGLGYGDAIADNLNNWADSVLRLESIALAQSDNLNNWADLYSQRLLVVLSENLSDTLTLTDSLIDVLGLREGLSDNLNNWADSYVERLLVPETEVLTDTLTLSDALATHVDPALYLSDQLVLAESIAITFPQPATSVSSLSFQVSGPGLTPAPQTINIFNALLGPLTFSITTDVPWIQVTPVSGTAPEDVQVSINTFGMGAGAYTGHIFVFGSGPAIVTITFVIGPGDVVIQAGGNTIGVINASGAGETSFLDVLYRYANLTLPYNPQDPGLQYTYDNSSLAEHVLLNCRFFNLLNEASTPLVVDVGTAGLGAASGGSIIISGNQLFECLDVRLFGAVGDGKTDDTAAVQRALDQASRNFQAQVAIGFGQPNSTLSITGNTVAPGLTGAPGPLGSTVVCIPSGVYCKVYPRIFSGGAENCIDQGSLAALLIDDGVTILCDGGLILGMDDSVLQAAFTHNFSTGPAVFNTNGQGGRFVILQNRQAFTGGPSLQGSLYEPYIPTIGALELGPRNTGIRITGEGFFDCGEIANGVKFQSYAAVQFCGFGGILFCKCDQSQIDSVTFQNFYQAPAVYWGHSEKINVFQCLFQHSYGEGLHTGGGSGNDNPVAVGMLADVLRESSVYANNFVDVDNPIQEWACFHTDIHDNNARQCGISCNGVHLAINISYLFCWDFSDPLNSDGNRYANHYANNRGLVWQPNMTVTHALGSGFGDPVVRIATPTSYLVGNDIWAAFPYTTQLYGEGTGGFTQIAYLAGVTGPTEPNWGVIVGTTNFSITTSPGVPAGPLNYVLDSPVSVSGAFVGYWSQVITGTTNFFYLPFGDIQNGNSVVLFKNGVQLVKGTDWFTGVGGFTPWLAVSFASGFAPQPSDVITCNVQTQILWADLTQLYVEYPNVPATLQVLGGFDVSSLPMAGVRLIANQISDNYMDGIGFCGLTNGQVSHSLIQRNTGGGIIDLIVEDPTFFSPSTNMEIIDNYSANNFGPNLDVPAGDGTIDNPAITPGSIIRGGVTQTFGNVVNGEVPAGVINGVNTVFTLAHTPLAGSLLVFKDGLRTTAYTLTGVTITFTTAPTTSVMADYEW